MKFYTVVQYNENLAYCEKIDKLSRVPLDCPSVCSAFLPFSVLRHKFLLIS